jgi:hypothetical protein
VGGIIIPAVGIYRYSSCNREECGVERESNSGKSKESVRGGLPVIPYFYLSIPNQEGGARVKVGVLILGGFLLVLLLYYCICTGAG